MWGSLIRIQKILQKRRPLRLVFSEEKNEFVVNTSSKSKHKIYLIDFSLYLALFACINGSNRVLRAEFQVDPALESSPEEQLKLQTQKAVLSSVLFFLFGALYRACVVSAWTFTYKIDNALALLKIARGLFLKRLHGRGKIPGGPTKSESAIFGALLYTMMLTCIFGYLAGCIICVVSDSNPGNVILTWIVPKTAFQEWPTLLKGISIIFVFTSGYYGVIPTMQAFAYIITLLFEMTYILRRGYNYDDSHKVKSSLNTFQREWEVYKENILFLREVNQFGTCLFPDTMMTAFCIIVATTTVCMKFHNELPITMLCVFLGFDVVVSVANCAVQNFTVVGKEESERFILYWKPRVFSKLGRRHLKACIPTAISVGPFFELQRSTLLAMGNEIVNMVVTFLLLDG